MALTGIVGLAAAMWSAQQTYLTTSSARPSTQEAPPAQEPVQPATGGGAQNPNYFNPQMSLVADFRAQASGNSEDRKRALFREAEIGLAADVDPFLKAEAYISFANDGDKTSAEVEEAFGVYTRFSKGMQLKVGKFAGAIGRMNRSHVDQLYFLDYPLVVQDLFGDEGLRAGGASIAYKFPRDRFNEITIEVVDPDDGPLFKGGSTQKPTMVGHYRTFFDFSEDLSGQLGFSYVNGPNLNHRAQVFGADYTMKWTPGTKGKSATFETEAYWSDTGISGAKTTFGAFGALSYEIFPRWFMTGKLDYSELPGTSDVQRAASLGLTFKLTEFEHWRVEFQHLTSNFASIRNSLNFQFQFAIGAHPAHKY